MGQRTTPKPFVGMLKINFPGTDLKAIPTLSEEDVEILPQKLISSLFQLSSSKNDLGDLMVLTYPDQKHYGTILRVVQFIKHQEYAPFNEDVKLMVQRREEESKPVVYEPKLHETDITFRATDETHAYFEQEVKVYTIAVASDFKDLQHHSMKKLLIRYPVYAPELLTLFDALSRNGIGSLIEVDPSLATFVSKRIATCRKDLLADETLPSALRKLITMKEELAAMIHTADDKTIADCIAHLSKDADTDKDKEALLDVFVANKLTQPLTTVSHTNAGPGSQPKLASKATTPLSDGFEARDTGCSAIFGAMADSRIIVAPVTGYGTLRRDRHGRSRPGGRNKDFRFHRGEVLVIVKDAHSTVNGYNDIVVQNTAGEIGEVYKNLKFAPLQTVISRSKSCSNTRRARYRY